MNTNNNAVITIAITTDTNTTIEKLAERLVNLTPHELNIHGEGVVITLPPSGKVCRVSTTTELLRQVGGVKFRKTTYGEIENLPEEDEASSRLYVVSGMVEARCPNREDVWSPGDLLRDENGKPIGCDGLKKS